MKPCKREILLNHLTDVDVLLTAQVYLVFSRFTYKMFKKILNIYFPFLSGHDDSCCTEKILQCTIQTYLKMTMSSKPQCSLVNFYDVCLNDDIAMTCSIDLKSKYLTLLKNECRQELRF